jgi:hypothetical protein
MFSNLYSFSSHMKWDNEYDRVNLDQYIEDCWRYAAVMGDVKPEDIQKNTDWMTLLKEGSFPLFYTLERTDANPKGTTVTCTAMYNNYIKLKFTNAYFEERLKSFCRTLGRDPDNAAEYQSCKDMISNHLDSIVGVNVDPWMMIMQTAIGERIDASLRSGDMADAAEVIGARDTGTAMVGAGLMANQFIPIFRNVIIAITIVMSPIVFLFFSIFGPNAFRYWIGGFIWAATWGVTDTIIDRFAQNYAYDVFAQIRDYQLGLGSLLLFDKESVRVLAVLGNMKTMAALISMALVEGIMGQVNASGAKMAGSLQGKMEGAGQTAGHTALTAEGSGSKIKDLESKLSVMANARDFSFNDRISAGTYNAGVSTQRSLNNVGEFGGGGGSVQAAVKAVAGGMSRSDQVGAYANEGLNKMGIVPGREGAAQAVEKGTGVKTTEKAVAGMGGVGSYSKEKSSADSLKAQENIKKDNEFYGGLQRSMGFDTPDQAAQYHGGYLGAENAAQAKAKLKSGANQISDNDLGVSRGSHSKFENMLNSSASSGELKSKVEASGDKDLNKLFSSYTKGNDNADIGDVKKEFASEQQMKSAGLAQRMGYAYAANQLGDVDSVYRNSSAMGLGNDVEGMRRYASFLKNGTMTDEMAQAANKAHGFEDGQGPFKAGMKADSWGVGDDGKFMVTKASSQDGSGSVEVGSGKVTEQGAFRNKGEAMAEVDRLRKDGHISAADGLENMANSILPGEAISYSRTKGLDGKDIASSYTHGSESQHYDLASEKEGAQLQNKDTANMVLDKHSAGLVNQVAAAKGWNTRFNAGDEVTVTGARGAYDWKNLGQVKSLDPNKISSITGGTGAKRSEEDLSQGTKGDVNTNHNYNEIHEATDGKRYKMTGTATTYGTGENAVTKMDLRSAMMQEVDAKGNAIGEKFSAGAAISQGKIINLEAEKGTDIATKDKKTDDYARGTNVNSGITLPYIMDNNYKDFESKYRDFARMAATGNSAPIRALAGQMGKELSELGDVKKGLETAISTSAEAGLKPSSIPVVGSVLSKLGINANLGAKATMQALDRVDTSQIKTAMQEVTSKELAGAAGKQRDPNLALKAMFNQASEYKDILMGQADSTKLGRMAKGGLGEVKGAVNAVAPAAKEAATFVKDGVTPYPMARPEEKDRRDRQFEIEMNDTKGKMPVK